MIHTVCWTYSTCWPSPAGTGLGLRVASFKTGSTRESPYVSTSVSHSHSHCCLLSSDASECVTHYFTHSNTLMALSWLQALYIIMSCITVCQKVFYSLQTLSAIYQLRCKNVCPTLLHILTLWWISLRSINPCITMWEPLRHHEMHHMCHFLTLCSIILYFPILYPAILYIFTIRYLFLSPPHHMIVTCVTHSLSFTVCCLSLFTITSLIFMYYHKDSHSTGSLSLCSHLLHHIVLRSHTLVPLIGIYVPMHQCLFHTFFRHLSLWDRPVSVFHTQSHSLLTINVQYVLCSLTTQCVTCYLTHSPNELIYIIFLLYWKL